MPPVDKCIFTRNKHKYARDPITFAPNILVDDKLNNVADWVEAGGVGIRFQANQDDLRTLMYHIWAIRR